MVDVSSCIESDGFLKVQLCDDIGFAERYTLRNACCVQIVNMGLVRFAMVQSHNLSTNYWLKSIK